MTMIVCAFPRASAGAPGKQPKGGFCSLGAECRYIHKCVQHARDLGRANSLIIYALTFDSTCGYPGEGPITIVSYNMNGAGHGALGSVLAQARKARVDIILLQELHAYADGRHLRACMTAKALGWQMVHAPANATDPASGVGIAIRDSSPRVKLIPDTSETLIEGRCLRTRCAIDSKELELISIYLSAIPSIRSTQIDTLRTIPLGRDHDTLVGGDFNCVENTDNRHKESRRRGRVRKRPRPQTKIRDKRDGTNRRVQPGQRERERRLH